MEAFKLLNFAVAFTGVCGEVGEEERGNNTVLKIIDFDLRCC